MGVMKRLLAEQNRKSRPVKARWYRYDLPDREGYFARNGDELLPPEERKKLLADYMAQQKTH